VGCSPSGFATVKLNQLSNVDKSMRFSGRYSIMIFFNINLNIEYYTQ